MRIGQIERHPTGTGIMINESLFLGFQPAGRPDQDEQGVGPLWYNVELTTGETLHAYMHITPPETGRFNVVLRDLSGSNSNLEIVAYVNNHNVFTGMPWDETGNQLPKNTFVVLNIDACEQYLILILKICVYELVLKEDTSLFRSSEPIGEMNIQIDIYPD